MFEVAEIMTTNSILIVFLSLFLLKDLHAGKQDFGEGSL